jgi:hypothetical protein
MPHLVETTTHILPSKVKCKLADYICQELQDSPRTQMFRRSDPGRSACEEGYKQNRIAVQLAGFAAAVCDPLWMGNFDRSKISGFTALVVFLTGYGLGEGIYPPLACPLRPARHSVTVAKVSPQKYAH